MKNVKEYLIHLIALVIFLLFFFYPNVGGKDKITTLILPENLIWSKSTTTSPWEARDAQAVYVWNNQLYMTGGVLGNVLSPETLGIEYWKIPHADDLWVSDDAFHWKKLSSKLPWKNRRSMTVETLNNKLWLLGGWNQWDFKYDTDIWESDDGTNWRKATSTSPIWSGREGQTLNKWNDSLWFTGGVNFSNRTLWNDVWKSSNGFNWQLIASSAPWRGRYDHAAAIFNDKLWISGGVPLNGIGKEFSDLWFTSDGINWIEASSSAPWGRRHGHIMLPWKGYLWIIGGWRDKAGLNDTWYSKDGINWKKTNLNGNWLGREDHAVIEFKDQLILLGGMDTNLNWNNDVWSAKLPEKKNDK